ncbi:MAG: hypothetical protein FJY67_06465 [Calditrichaeota bacterium]|nr:hypothetical protein [Calditrichota bacterium]
MRKGLRLVLSLAHILTQSALIWHTVVSIGSGRAKEAQGIPYGEASEMVQLVIMTGVFFIYFTLMKMLQSHHRSSRQSMQ